MALALVLIIEGMLPFVSPRRYRKLISEISQLRESQIRTIGFVIMRRNALHAGVSKRRMIPELVADC